MKKEPGCVPWFKFRGIDSREMGIFVTKLPEAVRPARNVETARVPGRSGLLHFDEKTYNSYTGRFECAIINKRNIDLIASWLVGSGDMILSYEQDKVRKAFVLSQLSLSDMMTRYQKLAFSVEFEPFKYSVNEFDEMQTLTAPTIFFGKGSIYSEPLITINGSGTVALLINGTPHDVRGVEGSVSIDSFAQEVFKDGESQNSKYMSESFPILRPGRNDVSWNGNVQSVEIIPRWRWL